MSNCQGYDANKKYRKPSELLLLLPQSQGTGNEWNEANLDGHNQMLILKTQIIDNYHCEPDKLD